MKMIRSRAILSVIMQFIIAVGTTALIFSFVMNFTAASPSYYEKRIPKESIVAECDSQLTKKYEMLAAESGFPERVFEMVKTDMPTAQSVNTALSGAFSQGGGSVYSQNLVDFFYNLCEDYADGNDLAYSKADLQPVAEKAARIYDDTVGVHSTELAQQKIKSVKSQVTLAQFVSFLIIVVCSFAAISMYGRKHLGYICFLGGIMGGGIGTLFASALLYLIKPYSVIDITPSVYAAAFGSATQKIFVVTAMLSVAVTVASAILMIHFEKQYQRKKDKVQIV